MSSKSPWKTGSAPQRRNKIVWPSLTQLLSQAVIIVIIAGVWGGLLFGFLRWTSAPQQTEALAAAEEPSPAPTVVPTDTPTQLPTFTPVPTPTSASTEPIPVAPTDPVETPTPEPTEPPTPTPAPTDTPAPVPTEEPAPADSGDTAAEVSFQNDVMPILERRCIKCHGGINDDGEERVEEGLKLLTHEDILKGSYNGPVVEPGDVENSYLIEQIVKGEMPKKEPRLLPAQIRIITAWVEAGAPNN